MKCNYLIISSYSIHFSRFYKMTFFIMLRVEIKVYIIPVKLPNNLNVNCLHFISRILLTVNTKI